MEARVAAETRPKRQLIVPVYNEGENIITLYRALSDSGAEFDTLQFIYDLDEDSTLPFIERISENDSRVEAVKNSFGRGVLNAIRFGFSQVEIGPVIMMMGDNSDKLSLIPEMIALWKNGATIVSPSRYMRGGEQHGGGLVKSGLSRLAGTSLSLLGFPTADPTNNFKLYDGTWLREQRIESTGGFEIALELCYKAFRDRKQIVELPTVWRDRSYGKSNFKLFSWLPRYLKWYLLILRELARRR